MNTRIRLLLFLLLSLTFSVSTWSIHPKHKGKNKVRKNEKIILAKEAKDKTKISKTIKIDSLKNKPTGEVMETIDTSCSYKNLKFKFYKKEAHASYYAQRFNGSRTASGSRFDNNSYTAAHKKLPFGTKIKVTNEANGKSVIVEVTDRGPFSKVREIDLSKRAFMELVDNKNSGAVMVKMELEDK
jgi:rare lipoprotein A